MKPRVAAYDDAAGPSTSHGKTRPNDRRMTHKRANDYHEAPTPSKQSKMTTEAAKSDDDLQGSASGCARCEPFDRNSEKIKKRTARMAQEPPRHEMATAMASGTHSEFTYFIRDEVVTGRRFKTVTTKKVDTIKINKRSYRKKMVSVGPSRIHGKGLFAMEDIGAADLIIEYVGELIRPFLSDVRETMYKRTGEDCYLFKVDEHEVIDSTRKGNNARFINHSCDPNTYAEVATVSGEKRIFVYSLDKIKKGDELTLDYAFKPDDGDKVACKCGKSKCRRFLS